MISEPILLKTSSVFLKGMIQNSLILIRYDDEERMVQRFLEGNQWKFKESYDQIMAHHKFL
jgi:hypothetical protein